MTVRASDLTHFVNGHLLAGHLQHMLSGTLILLFLRLLDLFQWQRHDFLGNESLGFLLLPEDLRALDLNAVQILQLGKSDDDLVHRLLLEETHIQGYQPRQGAQRGYHLVMLQALVICRVTLWKGF